jgi:hypothetical protein
MRLRNVVTFNDPHGVISHMTGLFKLTKHDGKLFGVHPWHAEIHDREVCMIYHKNKTIVMFLLNDNSVR